MEDAKGFAGELAVKWATWLGRGLPIRSTLQEMLQLELPIWYLEVLMPLLALLRMQRDYSSKEWFLDKANKHISEWFDQIEDATKSKVGKTFVGEKISDGVGFIGEIASPMWVVWKVGNELRLLRNTSL
jgi:hypothetical protein